MKEYNLILDLDGTLVSIVQNNKCHLVRARPNLSYFLYYVFSKFKTVSIWTNATTSWYMYCYENILKQNMPSNEYFSLIITSNNGVIDKKKKFDIRYMGCNDDIDGFDEKIIENLYVKDLEFLYEKYPQFNKDNTLIVDDMPYTYCLNPQNAIPIKSYEYDFWSRLMTDSDTDADDDSELLRIVFYFKVELFSSLDLDNLTINV